MKKRITLEQKYFEEINSGNILEFYKGIAILLVKDTKNIKYNPSKIKVTDCIYNELKKSFVSGLIGFYEENNVNYNEKDIVRWFNEDWLLRGAGYLAGIGLDVEIEDGFITYENC